MSTQGVVREWRIKPTWPQPPLSLNRNLHWHTQARIVAAIKHDIRFLVRAQRIPALDRAHIELHWCPKNQRRRDTDNIVPTLKAIVDAVVDEGVIPDDTPQWVTWQTCIDEPDGTKTGRVWVTIREIVVPDEAA